MNCRSWEDQTDFFKDRFKVILVNLQGFGKSGQNRQDWSMQHYGKDIAGLCWKLELKDVYLAGWSMGTGVVIEAARIPGKDANAVITVDQLWYTDNDYDNIAEENWYNDEVSRYKDLTKEGSKSVPSKGCPDHQFSRRIPDLTFKLQNHCQINAEFHLSLCHLYEFYDSCGLIFAQSIS